MTWEIEFPRLLPAASRAASPRLEQLIEGFGEWLDTYAQAKCDQLPELINPETVPGGYVQYLADLIGFTINPTISSDAAWLRRQLTAAPQMLRNGGGYHGLAALLYICGVNGRVWELYSADYVTFARGPWLQVAPPGFGDPVKTPHFELELLPDYAYGVNPTWFLLTENMFLDINNRLEAFRPLDTVPHFSIYVPVITDQQLTSPYVIELSKISAIVTTGWDHYSAPSPAKFKIGSGRKGATPSSAWTDLETPLITGDITSIVTYADRWEITLDVPAAGELDSISEIGVFSSDLATMWAVAVTPDLFKPDGVAVRVLLTIYADPLPR